MIIISKQAVGIVGETHIDYKGRELKIIEYNNSKNIIVEFDNNYKTTTTYKHFKEGKVRYPYDKTVFNVGFLGEGRYKTCENNEMPIYYKVWRDMLKRCYCTKEQERYPTYLGCVVCEEWHNFQNFAQWFNNNWYEVEEQRMCLDKDILYKGNKLYSPDTCVIVPQFINTLFVKNDADRGKYPIGVTFKKSTQRYTSYYSRTENGIRKRIHLGYFDDPNKAFICYKKAKEKYIKEVANYYKDKIPQKLYIAMNNYIVEIDD